MRYLAKRIGMGIITLYLALTIAFVMFRLMPGGPVEAYRAQLMAQAVEEDRQIDIQEINERVEIMTNIDPGKPVHEAYFDYLYQVVVNQNFGNSIVYREDVFDVLFAAMPWSVFISVYGLLLGFTVSIFLGALMAYKEGTWFDYGLTVWDQVLGAIPYYVAALLFLSYLAFEWGLFPTGGRYNDAYAPGFNPEFMWSVVRHAALPIMTGFVLGFGGSLSLRANAIKILGSEYLRSAKLRGVNTGRIATRYVIRNAILPIYTGLLIGISGIFGGSVITEQIFAYPGVGWYMFEALVRRDYPLLMASFIFYTSITLAGILIADLTYSLVDPRIKTGGERESF